MEQTKKLTLDDIFPPNWLKADQFKEGETRVYTINGWQIGKFQRDGQNEKSIEIGFEETEAKLGLNVGNRNEVAKIAGSRAPDDWNGTKIELFTIWTEARGETKRGIRIRKPATNGNGHATTIEALKDVRARCAAAGIELVKLQTTDIDTPEKLEAQIKAHTAKLAALVAATI